MAPVRALGRIGVVFQQMTLDLDLSVEANLVFHARLHGLGGAESRARIADVLARVGLAERRADRVRELSGGNRRKVELARALLHRPAVLLMDEATVGLDPASRRHLLDEVLALRAARRRRAVGLPPGRRGRGRRPRAGAAQGRTARPGHAGRRWSPPRVARPWRKPS